MLSILTAKVSQNWIMRTRLNNVASERLGWCVLGSAVVEVHKLGNHLHSLSIINVLEIIVLAILVDLGNFGIKPAFTNCTTDKFMTQARFSGSDKASLTQKVFCAIL